MSTFISLVAALALGYYSLMWSVLLWYVSNNPDKGISLAADVKDHCFYGPAIAVCWFASRLFS